MSLNFTDEFTFFFKLKKLLVSLETFLKTDILE